MNPSPTVPQTPAEDALYPPGAAWNAGTLDVGGGHCIAYTQRGAADGIPALVIHGGPGSGSSPQQARFFDPGRYRVIQFDQRGCGRSRPAGETRLNRTELLVADCEALRRHLGVDRWLVVGGSWGATLAAVYAAAHRPAISGVLLRGLFLSGRGDLDWFFGGAAAFFPEAWEAFVAALPEASRDKVPAVLAHVFRHGTETEQASIARAWSAWERTLSALPPAAVTDGEALDALRRRYCIQSHFLAHRCWLGEAAVLTACAGLRGLPVLFVHGGADFVCRPQASWRAHRGLPGSALQWVEAAGHDPFHPAMAAAMVAALDRFVRCGSFAGAAAT